MDDMRFIENEVIRLKKRVERDTEIMLDMWETDEDFKIPYFTISYNGGSVDIPLDFAEINNEIQEFLGNLVEIISEY